MIQESYLHLFFISQYFCRNTCNNRIIRNRLIDDSICTNSYIITYCYTSKNNASFSHIHIISNSGNSWISRITSSDRNLLTYCTKTSNPTFRMNHYPHSTIPKESSIPNFCLIWHFTIIN